MRSRWRGRAASVLWPTVSGRIHRPDRTFNLGDAEGTTDNFLADGAGPQHRSAVEHPSSVTKTSWLRTGRERRHSLLSGEQGGHEEQRSALEKRSSWSDERAPHASKDEARGIDWRSDPFAIGATFANPRHPDIAEEWHLHSVGFHIHSAEKIWTPATRHLRFTYAYAFKPDPPSSASEDGGNQSARFDGPTKLLPGPKYRRAPSPPGLLLAAWKYEAAQHPDVEGSGRATNRTAMRCLTFKLPSADHRYVSDWTQTVNVNADALQASDCERWRWRPRDEVPEMDPLMQKGRLGRRNIWQLQAVLPAAEQKRVGWPHCLRSMPRHAPGAKMRVELAPCNATLQPGTGFFGVLKRLPADKFRRAFSLPSNSSNSSSSHKVKENVDPLTVDLTRDVFSFGRSVHTVGRYCVKAKTLAEGAGEDDPGVVDCKHVNTASNFDEEARIAFAFKRAGGADDQSGHVLRPGVVRQGEAQNLTPRKRWPSVPGILVSAGDYNSAADLTADDENGGLPLTPTFAKSPSSGDAKKGISCLTFESEDMFRQLFDHDGKKKLLRTAHYKKLLRSRIGVVRRPTPDGCARWRWFPLWKNPVDMHEGPVRNMWELRLYLPPGIDGTLAPQCLQTKTLSTSLPMPLALRDCGGGGEVPEQRLQGMVTATILWQRWALHRLDARKFRKVWQKPRRSKTSTSTSRPEDAEKGGMPASVLLILMVAGSVGIGMLVGLPIAHFAGCALCGYSEGPLESEEETEFRDSTSGRSSGGRALGAAKGKGGGRAGSGSGANAQEGPAGPTSAFDFFWSDGPSSKGKKKVRRKKR
eukprot:g11169.t1